MLRLIAYFVRYFFQVASEGRRTQEDDAVRVFLCSTTSGISRSRYLYLFIEARQEACVVQHMYARYAADAAITQALVSNDAKVTTALIFSVF